jgi:hypothetical protein
VFEGSPLLDVDAAGLGAIGLGHDHFENAILQGSFDCVLFDSRGEAEQALEGTVGPLGDPELMFRLGGLTIVRLGDLGRFGRLFVLDGGFVGLFSLTDDLARWRARFSGSFVMAGDLEGMVVSELDGDVLLIHAGNLALEGIGFLGLPHIEARGPRGSVAARGWGEVIEGFVEEIEERTEVVAGWADSVGAKGHARE